MPHLTLDDLYRQIQEIGGRLVLQDGRLQLLAKKEFVTPSFLEELKKHRDSLVLVLEKGVWESLCFRCGVKTTFFPTPEVLEVFRRWKCGRCSWKLWRREVGEYPSAILKATLQAFPGSAVVYYEKASEEEGIESNGEE